MANFETAYKLTIVHEGGYANVRGDKGGETYRGISRVFHPNWQGWDIVDKSKPLVHNEIIESNELNKQIRYFYKTKYWDKLKGDIINNQKVANLLYDYYVHSGLNAIKAVQRIVGTTADGIIGNMTINAINNFKGDLNKMLFIQRRDFLINLSTHGENKKFLKGWLNRVNQFI